MAAGKDKMGRPLVVVTGLGVVTSLGAGKTDNWAKLDGWRIRHQDDYSLSHRRFENPHRRDH